MTDKIRQHLSEYAISKGWATDDKTLIEILTEATTVYEEDIEERRHWTDEFRVTEINGMLIGYNWITGMGDMSPRDIGWEFDPSTIREVTKHTKTIDYYI